MTGHIFIAPGDITQLSADAIAFSASTYLGRDGNLCSSFEANVPGFSQWYAELHLSQTIPVELGSTYWMPLSADRKPHGVVVVVSTGGGDTEDKAGLAVRRAIAEAAGRLRESGRTDRLLIALPAFRVGRGGDHRQRLKSARAQLQAAVEALKEHDGVDVAFLTYTPALYRIFLEARHEMLGPQEASIPRYSELVQALQARACVLFVGAGLSTGAGMPSWDQFIARLRQELKIADEARVDHLDLAQWYREHFGKKRLAELLRTTFSTEGPPTLAHYLLMALPLRHVITTNYDRLLEQALMALKRHPLPVIRQEDVVHTGGAGVYVVKLHGDAQHPDQIVLTRDDYHTFFENRPAMALLLEGLLLNHSFV
jgi:O-acetyl-ADP-ribose deacetylase (regulator of RNase III)